MEITTNTIANQIAELNRICNIAEMDDRDIADANALYEIITVTTPLILTASFGWVINNGLACNG